MLPWVFDHLNVLWNSFDWAKAANIAVILAGVYTYLKIIKPMLKAAALFLEDWNGENPRPGIKPRPGVMKRLEFIEGEYDIFIQSEMAQNKRLAALEVENAELRRAVKRIEGLITPVATYVKEHTGVIPAQKPAASSQG